MMKIVTGVILGLIICKELFCQYEVKTIDKSQLGVETGKTIQGGHLVLPIFITTGFIKQSKFYNSFLEKDNKLLYYQDHFIYDLSLLNESNFPKRNAVEDEIKSLIKDTLQYNLNKLHIPNSSLNFYEKHHVDSRNRVWLYPSDSIIYYTENNSLKHILIKNMKANFKVNQINETKDGIIWVASNHGLFKVDNGTLAVTEIKIAEIKHLKVSKIAPLKDGGLILLYNRKNLGIYHDNNFKKMFLPGQRIMDLVSDNSKNVRVVLSNGIKLILNDNEFLDFSDPDGQNGKLVNSFTDSRGDIWFVNQKSIGHIPENKLNSEVENLSAKMFKGFFENNNEIWFLGDGGSVVYYYNRNEFIDINKFYSKKNETGFNWAATHYDFSNSGLSNIYNDKMVYYQYNIITTNSSLPGVFSYEEANEYSLLFLSVYNGLIDLKSLLNGRDNRPLNVFIDSKGDIWVDTPTQIHKIVQSNK